jgi:hypothetical protein
VLLHRLAGLGSYAWKGNPHAYCYRHFHPRDSDGNPAGHPIDHQRAIPHPQPAYRYSDIHPLHNTYSHDHSHPCAFVDAIPAAHAHVYSQADLYTGAQLDTHPAHDNVNGITGAAHIHRYPHPADSDAHLLTAAAKRNCNRDTHAHVDGTVTIPFPDCPNPCQKSHPS